MACCVAERSRSSQKVALLLLLRESVQRRARKRERERQRHRSDATFPMASECCVSREIETARVPQPLPPDNAEREKVGKTRSKEEGE